MRVPVGDGLAAMNADLFLDDFPDALAHLGPVPRVGVVGESLVGLAKLAQTFVCGKLLETFDVLTELPPIHGGFLGHLCTSWLSVRMVVGRIFRCASWSGRSPDIVHSLVSFVFVF